MNKQDYMDTLCKEMDMLKEMKDFPERERMEQVGTVEGIVQIGRRLGLLTYEEVGKITDFIEQYNF